MKTSGGYAWITDSATKGRTEKKRKTIGNKRKTIVADRRRRGGSKKRRKTKTSIF